ncbi:UvrD-helicase domain-containing protein [Corynebacterium sp. TAE3-ERU12]|uniref:UvrD-helicase domain-containing protein n=1 Tax=Corynebacterium sp. TAE3-ERU12 TaxID=2849491 RepID=UPI001C47B818|nr:UvrD-helicase domain-containing protein [Corynebacterium sp. TAE3-ERU12]MBV7296140.1 UvrD-helicase domain-containing protein [Corynebacterium sp. TAE3-ERU12]
MKSTIITASAGSGKTYTITSEIADRIADGLAPERIIATTFTVKAAKELSDRIRGKLLSRGLLSEARGVSAALVGTVNAISARLTEDFAIDTGVSPTLETISEDSADLAFGAAVNETLSTYERAHAKLLHRMGYDRREQTFKYDRTKSWADEVRRLAETARGNLVSPDELRAAADASVHSYLEMLTEVTPVKNRDDRDVWQNTAASRLSECINLDAGKTSGAATKRVEKFTKLINSLSRDPAEVPWSDWATLAIPEGSATKRHRDVLEQFQDIQVDIAANPAFRADAEDLIRLVFTAAAESIDTYTAYKRRFGLLDFVDQEVLALSTLRSNEKVRQAIRDSYDVLVVDEFQDTNPIQLAIFSELAELVDEIIWVGDPKQSIYGFRGADANLMRQVLADLQDQDNTTVRRLDQSWRSHEQPLAFTNALFGALMPDMDVALTVPEQIAAHRRDGSVVLWGRVIDAELGTKHQATVAHGVYSLIQGGTAASDIAVLARTTAHVEQVTHALGAMGIKTTSGSGDPLSTREGQIIRAGLAWLADRSDTQAIVELITLLDDHEHHDDWLTELTALPDLDTRFATLHQWATDPCLAKLEHLRPQVSLLTPAEAVQAVAAAVQLRRRIGGWTNPRTRAQTIEILTDLADSYAAGNGRSSAACTIGGFLTWLDSAEPSITGTDDDAVFVGTMHAAKGLEWDTVITYTKPFRDKFTTDGVWVESAATPRLADPLAGRVPYFWPANPGKDLDRWAQESAIQQRRYLSEIEEEQRLAYVALTRAARNCVICHDQMVTTEGCTLDRVVASPSSDIDLSIDLNALTVRTPEETFTVPARLEWPPKNDEIMRDDPAGYRVPGFGSDALVGNEPASDFVPARVAPSSVPAGRQRRQSTTITTTAMLGDPLFTDSGKHWDAMGDCVHSFLALPLHILPEQRQRSAADRLREAWGVTNRISTEQMLEVGRRWIEWLNRTYPDATVHTEVPITWTNASNQLSEGWIDALVKKPDGSLVVVDHKTFAGADHEDKIRHSFLGQLFAYADALLMMGERVDAIQVHLPLKGLVVTVKD